MPTAYSLRAWERIDTLAPALANSLGLAVAASLLATGFVLLMVVLNEKRQRPLLRLAIYAPLMVPQVSLVLGLQAVLVWFWLIRSLRSCSCSCRRAYESMMRCCSAAFCLACSSYKLRGIIETW